MFSLIITIISIALVAALAVATIYYGGDVFKKGGTKAEAARIMTAGAQINGAVETYKATQGDVPATLNDLVTSKFLTAIPQGEWTLANDYIVATGITEEQCKEANRQLGITGATVPACTDTSVQGITACCSTPDA
jgi:hypothetical protein